MPIYVGLTDYAGIPFLCNFPASAKFNLRVCLQHYCLSAAEEQFGSSKYFIQCSS